MGDKGHDSGNMGESAGNRSDDSKSPSSTVDEKGKQSLGEI